MDACCQKGQHRHQAIAKGGMDRLAGFLVFFLGSCILWKGRSLSLGSLHTPGPGFFPTLIAIILMILSLFLIIPSRKKQDEGTRRPARSFSRMLVVFLALLAYFLLLEYLGFVIVSFLFMAFLFFWVGRQRWYVALSSAGICTVLAYILFEVLLKSSFPRGVFGF